MQDWCTWGFWTFEAKVNHRVQDLSQHQYHCPHSFCEEHASSRAMNAMHLVKTAYAMHLVLALKHTGMRDEQCNSSTTSTHQWRYIVLEDKRIQHDWNSCHEYSNKAIPGDVRFFHQTVGAPLDWRQLPSNASNYGQHNCQCSKDCSQADGKGTRVRQDVESPVVRLTMGSKQGTTFQGGIFHDQQPLNMPGYI